MSNVTYSPTPFGTVVVEAVVPATEVGKFKRSVSATRKRHGLAERLSVREHTFGQWARVAVIYRKASA
jgi:hypothetical protein